MRVEEKNGQLSVVDFNELEAYKIATKIEQDGIRFYKSLIQKTNDASVKEALVFLLQEESNHLAFFQRRLSEVGHKIEDGFEEDDILNYMDYGIFQPYQNMDGMMGIIDDVNKAIDLGIVVEGRTVNFYQICKEKITCQETKTELQNIIDEEERHRKLLENIIK